VEISDPELNCFNCGQLDAGVPLVEFRYQGRNKWVYSQYFPTLILQPQKLSGKLLNIENVPPADHDH
jgi:hypothetical protein